MKINGSLARSCIKDLEEKGMIKPVVQHSKLKIYSTSLALVAWPWLSSSQLLRLVSVCMETKDKRLTEV